MKKLVFLISFCLVSSLATSYQAHATETNDLQIDNPGKHRHHVHRTRKSRRGDRVVRTYHQPYAKTYHVSNRISSILK